MPVSAAAKFTPLMPMSAVRNLLRSRSRAKAQRAVRSSGSGYPAASVNSRATWGTVLCTAGAMMCEGISLASWMMYSPRSVSTTSTPSASSAALRWISSVAIDFDLTTSRTPSSRVMPSTIWRASSGPAARWTVIP